MKYTCQQKEGINWIQVEGRLDGETSETFDRHLQSLLDEGQKNFAIDFSELHFLNSRGLSSLIHLSQSTARQQGKVVVLGLKGPVRDVFEAAQLDTLIKSVGSPEEARQEINSSDG